IKHGLTAAEIVVPGEDPRAFEVLLANIEIDHLVETVRERDLAFQMAAARWRLRRLTLMEKAIIDREMSRAINDTTTRRTPEEAQAAAWVAVAESSVMKQVHRHETRLHRQYEKNRIELDAIVTDRMHYEKSGGTPHPCYPEGPVEQTVIHEAAVAAVAAEAAAAAVQNEPVIPFPEPRAQAVQNEPNNATPPRAAKAA
ncbi:MAG: hypothetical protein SGI92_22845, partial [Bryobacteraceae bacterium]|nr:hypothetical protein [Bryobacteraceae bacterium]